MQRRIISYVLVVALAVVSALTAKRTHKPLSPAAPEFRKKGPRDAKILIVEFSDFQCPACRVAETTLRQLLELYDGKIHFIFKHYPLRMHPWAKPAALAAECAGRQGKFWEYHDRLYDRQEDWTNAKVENFLAGYARDLKLDIPAWKTCRASPDAAAALAADMKDGDNAWIGGTPTFFVNGRRFVAKTQLAELGTLFIEQELKK